MNARSRFRLPLVTVLAIPLVLAISYGTVSALGSSGPSVAPTWNAMSLGSMPNGDNSGFVEFRRIGTSTDYFTEASNEMHFGNWFGSNWNSFTQFDPTLFSGKTIGKATLNLYVNYCASATAGAEYNSPIHVRRATGSWYYGQQYPGPATTDDAIGTAGPYRAVAIDITQIAKAWTDPAKNFGLEIDLGNATNTYCRAARIGPGGQQSTIEITYGDTPSVITNQSFEAGKSGWTPCYNPSTIRYDTPDGSAAFDGTRILRFNSTAGDGSVCQSNQWKPRAGDRYQLAIKVRSANGKPVSGTASIWEVRDASFGPSWNASVNFIADGEWREYRTSACARNAEATSLKTEIYVGTPNENLDVDFVQVAIGNPSLCS